MKVKIENVKNIKRRVDSWMFIMFFLFMFLL